MYSTCGILHCYGGGGGYYANPDEIYSGFPTERIYVTSTGGSQTKPKYVYFQEC